LKIAYLVTDESINLEKPGGPSAHISGTLEGFAAYGVDAREFCASSYLAEARKIKDSPYTLRRDSFKRLLPGKIRLIGRDLRYFLKHRVLPVQMISDIEGFDPDIVYERSQAFSVSGQQFCRDRDIPHVIETSGCTLEILRDTFGVSSTLIGNTIERFKFRKAAAVVVESRNAVGLIREKFGLVNTIIAKPLACDLPKHHKVSTKLAQFAQKLSDRYDFVIAFLGTFGAYQGSLFLMDAISELDQLDPQIGFLLIGAGGKQSDCITLSRSKGLENCIFTGLVPSIEVPNYLSLCDAAIVPDCVPHMSPVKTLAYGANGLATIVPDYPAFNGIIEHGETGLTFVPHALDSMVKAIHQLAANPTKTRGYGEAFRQKVATEFQWEHVVQDIVDFSRKLIGKRQCK